MSVPCARMVTGTMADGGIVCPNEGRWLPVLLLRPKGYTGAPIRSVLRLFVCDEHAKDGAATDYISDAGWNQIVTAIRAAGRVVPDRSLTEVTHILCNSTEAQMWLRRFVRSDPS